MLILIQLVCTKMPSKQASPAHALSGDCVAIKLVGFPQAKHPGFIFNNFSGLQVRVYKGTPAIQLRDWNYYTKLVDSKG